MEIKYSILTLNSKLYLFFLILLFACGKAQKKNIKEEKENTSINQYELKNVVFMYDLFEKKILTKENDNKIFKKNGLLKRSFLNDKSIKYFKYKYLDAVHNSRVDKSFTLKYFKRVNKELYLKFLFNEKDTLFTSYNLSPRLILSLKSDNKLKVIDTIVGPQINKLHSIYGLPSIIWVSDSSFAYTNSLKINDSIFEMSFLLNENYISKTIGKLEFKNFKHNVNFTLIDDRYLYFQRDRNCIH